MATIIRNIEGKVLYRDRAKSRSRKEFIASLVARGKSLAGADLSDANLSHLDLDGAIFDGARLAGANLTGTSLRQASLRDCDLRGSIAPGLLAAYADFTGADLSRHPDTEAPTLLDGAILTFAKFDGAKLHGTQMDDGAMSSASFIGAELRKVMARRARLHNVDWSHSLVIGSIFDQADMTPTLKAVGRHLPDRTSYARIVGNSLKATEIGEGNVGFGRDRIVSKAANLAVLGMVSGGLFAVGSQLEVDEGLLSPFVGKGMGLIVLMGTVSLLKDKLTDKAKDRLLELAGGFAIGTRAAAIGTYRRARAFASLALAYVTRDTSDKLTRVIDAVAGKDSFARLGTVLGGRLEVIVCRRKVLARALTAITETLDARGRADHDVVIVNPGISDGAPEAIICRADGSMTATWKTTDRNGGRVSWDETGLPDTKDGPDREGTVRDFIAALLRHHGAADMLHDDLTHSIRTGVDGSIVVVRNTDGRVDNGRGPAILCPNDERIHVRNGRLTDGVAARSPA